MRLVVILLLVGAIGIFMVRAFYANHSAANPQSALRTYQDLRDTIEGINRKTIEREAENPLAEQDVVAALQNIDASSSLPINKKSMTLGEKLQTPAPTILEIKAGKKYTARLHTTAGTIEIALNAGTTPITVSSFVYLARLGFYNDTIFHRVISGFMIQGGDPKGDGTGGPAYRFNDEKFSGNYERGTVAMANAGPNTNGSQFFIMHQEYPLAPDYVIFGQVIKGLDVVDKIASAPVQAGANGEDSAPVNPVTVRTVEIVEE